MAGKYTKHGLSNTKLYHVWFDMVDRCTNPEHKNYKNYGGRGITVCDEWIADVKRFIADMGPTYVEGLTLDRIHNDKGYYYLNCDWVTPSKNAKNRRNSIQEQSEFDYVTYDKQSRKWQYLRKFKSKEDAETFAAVVIQEYDSWETDL